MQRIQLLSIGTLKSSWLREGCADYTARLSRQCRFEMIELVPSKAKDPLRQREEESETLLKQLNTLEGTLYVLDEHGEEKTSVAFAHIIQDKRDTGTPIIFVLGGAYGFDDRIRKRADHLLALSTMTLPHELCRLVFLEQLYRAHEMIRGSKYHHG